VLDAVAPGRKVHLVGHDWGSIQSWEAVCTMGDRFASFTSISGPCLDHVAHWSRGRLRRPTPRNLRQAAGQGLRSWYIYSFQTPVLPELAWRTGALRRLGGAREGIAGIGLYRANMLERLRHPRERRTDVPTQVIVPAKDPFVSPHLVGGLQDRAPNLRIRTLAAGHWVQRSHPDVVARWITEHITGEAPPA
jgi:pimeloyl-ACP methyl ester carboxylesterase